MELEQHREREYRSTRHNANRRQGSVKYFDIGITKPLSQPRGCNERVHRARLLAALHHDEAGPKQLWYSPPTALTADGETILANPASHAE